jgi:hypothetical protein
MSTHQATARIVESGEYLEVHEEDGTVWDVFADDGCGNLALERDAGERWEVALFGGGTLYGSDEGDTFDVSCRDEYIVRVVDNAGSLRWVENDRDGD